MVFVSLFKFNFDRTAFFYLLSHDVPYRGAPTILEHIPM